VGRNSPPHRVPREEGSEGTLGASRCRGAALHAGKFLPKPNSL